MAGSLSPTAAGEHLERQSVIVARDQWHQIHFSRFFTHPKPPLSSTCPSLVPFRHCRKTRGNWISTSSPSASLHIIDSCSTSDPILLICFQGKILEEHYVSKLQYSWPQVSCVQGYPARGSRILFVSYSDSVGEAQKFALRFSTNHEAETFVNALKEILKSKEEPDPLNSDFQSEISPRSELMSSNIRQSRGGEELSIMMSPVDMYTPEMPPNLNHEVEQPACFQETMLSHTWEGISAALPPSFGSLLANCGSDVKQVGVQSNVYEEVDLKSQITRYIEDSSFRDLLIKVEKIIDEMGGDMML